MRSTKNENKHHRTGGDPASLPVYKLKPKLFCGLTIQYNGSVQFLDDNRITYPIGKTLVVDDMLTRRQRYLQLPKFDRIIRNMVLSPNRQYLAVSETSLNKPTIAIFSTLSLKQIKHLYNPLKTCTATQFAALSFMCDNKHLAAVIGDPDWIMLIYNWERAIVNSEIKIHPGKVKQPIHQILCHPSDMNRFVFIGTEVFRMMHFVEKNWLQYGYRRTESTHVTCACWISPIHLIVGTENGKLLAIENGNLKRVFNADTTSEIDLKTHNKNEGKQIGQTTDPTTSPVKHLIGYEIGFSFSSTPGAITVFEKVEKTIKNTKWFKRGVFLAQGPPIGNLDLDTVDIIQQVAISQGEKTLICTTLRNEVFYGPLKEPDTWKDSPNVLLSLLFNGMHHGPLAAVSAAVWKSIFITAGKIDRTLILWDFNLRKIKFRKVFNEDILSASLHPTGFFCVVGFPSKIKLLSVFIDDFKFTQQTPIPNCTMVQFSNGGQIFAALDKRDIHIISSMTLKCFLVLKAHTETIINFRFSKDDYFLYACCEKSLFKWDLKDETRDIEFENSHKHIFDVVHADKYNSVYMVTFDSMIKEVQNGKLHKVHDMSDWWLTSLVISNNENMMYVAGLNGSILAVTFPIGPSIAFVEYSMHTDAISELIVTQTDSSLISASKDGAICIWEIIHPDTSPVEPIDDFRFLTETLVSYEDYIDHKKRLNDMKNKLKDMDEENEYIIKQMVANNENNLNKIQRGYKATIADLENKIKMLEKSHQKELDECNITMEENAKNNAIEMENLKKQYDARVEDENNRNQNTIYTTKKYVEEYWQKLRIFEKASKKAMETIARDKEGMILRAMRANYCMQRKLNDLKTSHDDTMALVEEDYQKEIHDLSTEFEEKMTAQEKIRAKLLSQRRIIMKRSIKINKKLQKSEKDVTRYKKRHERMQRIIQKKHIEIARLKVGIQNRKDKIKKRQIEIVKTVRSQRDFHKLKFVSDVRIETLKDKLIPLEEKIQQYNTLDDELEKVLKNKDRIIDRTKKMVNQLSKNCAGLKRELKSQNDIRYGKENLIKKLKSEIRTIIYNFAENPKQLRSTLLTLLNRYVAARHADEKQDPSATIEFMRQRRHLEASAKNLRSLKSRKPRIVVKYKRTCAQASKNHLANLVNEVKRLRRCWKGARRKVQLLEKLIGVDDSTFLTADEKFDKVSKLPDDIEREAMVDIWGYYLTLRILMNELERLTGQNIMDYVKSIKGKITHLIHSRVKSSERKKKVNLIEKVIRNVMSEQSIPSEKSERSIGGWNPTQRVK